MNENTVSDDGLARFRAPCWRCPTHGDTDAVVTVYGRGVAATYCLHCVFAVLERLGLKPVHRID